MRIIIIGAGISSLTLAAHLVKDGHEVIIIDKNTRPGGVMALYQENGYSFLPLKPELFGWHHQISN